MITTSRPSWSDAGTTIIKIMLHISPDEQKARLLARLDDPTKQWKFNPADVDERGSWNQYQEAYEIAIRPHDDGCRALVRRARRPQVVLEARGAGHPAHPAFAS